MADDKKISELTALTAASADDYIPIIDDPAGSIANKYITIANLFTSPRITTSILDSNGHNIFIVSAGAGDIVNEITVSNSITNVSPKLQASGTDSNINLILAPKGAGYVNLQNTNMRVCSYSHAVLAENDVSTDISTFHNALLFIVERTNAYCAAFFLAGGLNTVTEIYDLSNKFSVTKDTSSSINIYNEGGTYKIQSKIGGSVYLKMLILDADSAGS